MNIATFGMVLEALLLVYGKADRRNGAEFAARVAFKTRAFSGFTAEKKLAGRPGLEPG
jgi:hypothetical protein